MFQTDLFFATGYQPSRSSVIAKTSPEKRLQFSSGFVRAYVQVHCFSTFCCSICRAAQLLPTITNNKGLGRVLEGGYILALQLRCDFALESRAQCQFKIIAIVSDLPHLVIHIRRRVPLLAAVDHFLPS